MGWVAQFHHHNEDPAVRFVASRSLGDLGSRVNVAASTLQNATNDSDPDVRQSAAASLIVAEAVQGYETVAVEDAITAPDAKTRASAIDGRMPRATCRNRTESVVCDAGQFRFVTNRKELRHGRETQDHGEEKRARR